MNHKQRIEIAQEIASRIVSQYGDAIVGIAVYGSVAKGEDADSSDLELWIATTGQLPSREVLCIYRGLPIELFYGPAEEFIADAQQVSPFRPLRADMRRSYRILYEQDGFFERVRQAATAVQDEDFIDAIVLSMKRTYELAGKLRNAWLRRDLYGVLALARDMAFSYTLILGLVNRRYYPSQRELYQRSMQMPLRPKHYAQLLDVAGGFSTTEAEHVYAGALELWEHMRQFIQELGIAWAEDRLVI